MELIKRFSMPSNKRLHFIFRTKKQMQKLGFSSYQLCKFFSLTVICKNNTYLIEY